MEFYVVDAKEMTSILKRRKFDIILMIWTSVLGYYIDEHVDIEILKQCRALCKDAGYLFILNTANRDLIALRHSMMCMPPVYEEADDIAIIETPKFNPETSVIENTWRFYKKLESGDLKFISHVSFRFRVYSLHELIRLADAAGWEYVEAYKSPYTLEPFIPSFSGLNVIFKAK